MRALRSTLLRRRIGRVIYTMEALGALGDDRAACAPQTRLLVFFIFGWRWEATRVTSLAKERSGSTRAAAQLREQR